MLRCDGRQAHADSSVPLAIWRLGWGGGGGSSGGCLYQYKTLCGAAHQEESLNRLQGIL